MWYFFDKRISVQLINQWVNGDANKWEFDALKLSLRRYRVREKVINDWDITVILCGFGVSVVYDADRYFRFMVNINIAKRNEHVV